MSAMPTAYHARNLFSLTMETRFGAHWHKTLAPETVAALADEIALGFNGQIEGPAYTLSGGAAPTQWRFPDGSVARTGQFGLDMDDDEADRGLARGEAAQ
ncbi:hypothetical protein CKO38_08930 [Rhodospirillum rubrum]|uniref:hypothetical protein n=1 Tax=Rhodospirillum rubrum TaxID=1085 RepID=UPI0019036ED6|nr:hypothetical protein [Rhodospirillum rubrum]MBK1665165.1 hypothetical protein [Rhodospirillum rubrum]MBK1676792.1 hypothetical protein [Rhodospirillum rubrum]